MEQDIQIAETATRKLTAKAIAIGLVCFAVYESAIGWLQICRIMPSLHTLFPATGTFYNPGPYCGFLAMMAPLALEMAMDKKSGLAKALGTACLIITLGIMPALMGRTGWIACAAGCMAVLGGNGRLAPLKKVQWPLWAALAVAAAALIVYLKPASALGRLQLWLTGLNACLLNPITGCGWQQVGGAMGEAQEAYFRAHPGSVFAEVASCPEYPFNDYLQIAIAYGIPAAIIFISTLFLCGRMAYRSGEYGLFGSIVAFSIVCFSSYPLQFPEFWIAGALVLIASLISACKPMNAAKYALTLAIAACAAYHYEVTAHGKDSDYDAARLFAQARSLRQSRQYEKSTEILLKGLRCSSDPMFLILIGRNCQDTGLPAEAAMWYERAINRLPSRMYPYYLMAKLYAEPNFYDKNKFEQSYAAFMKMHPKIESPATRQMKEELSALNDSIHRH